MLTAEQIRDESKEALEFRPTDTYHKNRLAAAELLISKGLKDATYGTQWDSGNSAWSTPGSFYWNLKVTVDGKITVE